MLECLANRLTKKLERKAMALLEELKALDLTRFKKALISTTAKQHGENRLLPFRQFGEEKVLNLLFTNPEIAQQVLVYLDNQLETFFIDVERKQSINLWQIAQNSLKKGKILPYKPNDLTVESAYHLINQYYDYQLTNKKILIYGTGNIAVKLALRLAEHDIQVTITGRNEVKTRQLIDALNVILPAYNDYKISLFNKDQSYDALITAVSAEQLISAQYLNYLNDKALVMDVGINNLTPAFIANASEKSISIIRLDVRIATPILEAHMHIADFPFFKTIAGHLTIQGISCVAGGIIGKKGDIVLDTVFKPKHIIGIANGTGGLKKYEEHTDNDKHHIDIIEKAL